MKRGDVLICKEDINGFKKNEKYKVIIIDNEKIHTMITLSSNNKSKTIPLELINKFFKKNV